MIINAADLDSVRIRYLERLYDHEQDHPGEVLDSGPFLMEESELTLVAALGLTRALDDLGLVKECNAMGNPSAFLLDAGREFVVRLRAHRDDAAVRSAAARKAVLAYVYDAKLQGNEHPAPAETVRCSHGEFLGARLREDESLRAVDYLEAKGLLAAHARNAFGKPTYVELTDRGEDCMELTGGDVAEYLQQQRPAQTVYHNQIGSISGGNGIAIGNSQVTQHLNVGVDPAVLRALVAMMLPELCRFGDAEPQVRAALDEIAEEAQAPQPDPGRLGKPVGQILDLAKQAGLPVLVAYLTHKAQEWGILPPPASGGSLPPAP